jgi:hypothetical protein
MVQNCESIYLFRLAIMQSNLQFRVDILMILYVLQLASYRGHFDYPFCIIYRSITEAADTSLP